MILMLGYMYETAASEIAATNKKTELKQGYYIVH